MKLHIQGLLVTNPAAALSPRLLDTTVQGVQS